MLENLRFYSGFLTLISGCVGILFWYKLPSRKSKLFLFSIWISLVMDFIGTNFTIWTGLLNYWVYNSYIFILFIIYILLLKSILKKLVYKYIAAFFCLFFIIISIINWCFLQNGFDNILTDRKSVV